MKKSNSSRCVVYFDFDNTITTRDVLEDIIKRFSRTIRWKALGRQWEKGVIGSRECMEEQLKNIRLGKKALDIYLRGIHIDSDFKKLRRFLEQNKAALVILSDNFDYIVRSILNNHGIHMRTVYCNRMRVTGGQLVLGFPLSSRTCWRCAHCKKDTLLARSNGSPIRIYIGDGLSDICPSRYAHLVFAKDELLKYYRKHNLPCIPFNSLRDVCRFLRTTLPYRKKP